MEFSLIQVILKKPLGAGAVLAEHHQLLHRVVGCGGPPRGGGSDALLHLHPGKVKGTVSQIQPGKDNRTVTHQHPGKVKGTVSHQHPGKDKGTVTHLHPGKVKGTALLKPL